VLAPALTALLGGALAGVAVVASAAVLPAAPFVLAAVGALVVLAYRRPEAALVVAVLGMPLQNWVVQAGIPLSVTQGAVVVACLGWGARLLAEGEVVLPRSAAFAGVALLLVSTAAGLLFAPVPGDVVKQVVNWGVGAMAFVVLAWRAGRPGGERAFRQVAFALVLMGGAVGALALVFPNVGPDAAPLTAGEAVRASGFLGSPNGLGLLLAVLVPLQVVQVLAGPVARRPVALACLVLTLAGLTASASRSALLGTAVACVVLLGWAPFRRTVALFALPVLLVAALGGTVVAEALRAETVTERLTTSREDAATNPRLPVYRAAPRMLADHPVFGIGALQFAGASTAYGVPVEGGVSTHAHNIVLTVGAELGVVGLAGLLTLAAGLVAALRRARRRCTGWALGLAVGLQASFACLAVAGMLDYVLSSADIFIVLAALSGLAVGAPSLAREAQAGTRSDARARSTPSSS
jgi:O-antigen ligase